MASAASAAVEYPAAFLAANNLPFNCSMRLLCDHFISIGHRNFPNSSPGSSKCIFLRDCQARNDVTVHCNGYTFGASGPGEGLLNNLT